MGLRSATPLTELPTVDGGLLAVDPTAGTEAAPPPAPGPTDPFGFAGSEPPQPLRISGWLFRSHPASIIWLLVRIWLGYQWINAGYQKLWGSERAVFWFGNGVAVKGFASAGVAGSTAGKGSGASYGWWAGFLHNFVVPNAAWIAKFISVAEVLVGVAILLGFFTGAAAAAGLSLNVIYLFTGSAGVNPMYAILSVLLVLAWRNAGWFGLDRVVLPAWRRLRIGVADTGAPADLDAGVPSS